MGTAQIIITSTGLLIQGLPAALDAAIKIRDLLRAQGLNVDIHEINREAIDANTEAQRLIEEGRANLNA